MCKKEKMGIFKMAIKVMKKMETATIYNQERILVPHSPNRNGDLPGDCTQNNRVTATTHFGSEVIHRESEASTSQSCS
jgi:hypothetical protein